MVGSVDDKGWVPSGAALDRPNSARIYDCLLGGYHNFEVDRGVVEAMLAVFPDLALSAQANRAFLRRAVEFIMAQGIEQILDLGSGIPTVGNVHQVAQSINPDARVVYVDRDPVAVAHSTTMLLDNPKATAIQMDVREVEAILNHEEVRGLLNLSRPLGILFVTVLHYVVDDQDAYDTVDAFTAVAAPGSYVVLAHSSSAHEPPERKKLAELFGTASTTQNRSQASIERFFQGLDLVEPGLVLAPLWRPEGPDDVLVDMPERAFTQVGVARKP